MKKSILSFICALGFLVLLMSCREENIPVSDTTVLREETGTNMPVRREKTPTFVDDAHTIIQEGIDTGKQMLEKTQSGIEHMANKAQSGAQILEEMFHKKKESFLYWVKQ